MAEAADEAAGRLVLCVVAAAAGAVCGVGGVLADRRRSLADVSPFLVPRADQRARRPRCEHAGELLSRHRPDGRRALCGFALSLAVGTLIGIAFSQSAIVRRSFYPYAIFLQTVPSVALAPLVILWFGHGFASVVVVAFIISLFPIITNGTAGLLAVDRNLLELFAMGNASRLANAVETAAAQFDSLFDHRRQNLLRPVGDRRDRGRILGRLRRPSFGLGYLIMQTSDARRPTTCLPPCWPRCCWGW